MSRSRIAREDMNTNIPLPFEPDAGEGLAPVFLSNDEFADRPFPTTNPFHYNENLIESRRRDRLAGRLVEIQRKNSHHERWGWVSGGKRVPDF